MDSDFHSAVNAALGSGILWGLVLAGYLAAVLSLLLLAAA
jgi:hypothetical protein